MSEDGFTLIIKGKDKKYRGYSCCASMEYKTRKDYEKMPLEFTATTIEEAILEAQKQYHEYGYNFYNA